MLSEVLKGIICYTPEAMQGRTMWCILPLALGNERAFLTWFYDGATARRYAIEPETVDEYLRTFSGREGVLGTMGVYQAAFTTIDQTEPLTQNKIRVPVVAHRGEKTLGENVHRNVEMVAENVEGGTVTECGHFVPEVRPDEIVGYVLALTNRTNE